MDERSPIVLREQQQLDEQGREYIASLNLEYSSSENDEIPPFLGLSADGWSSYYVGAAWLKENSRPLVVRPKIDNIDFLGIFAEALSDNVSPVYFQKAYSIKLDTPFIEDEALNAVLTPLMVAHFVSVMRLLLSSGLKRSYIIREENLKNKVRGHILPLSNLQKNILRGHAEKALCRFQEYSFDYPENRLLKRGLLAAESLLLALRVPNNALLQLVRKCLLAFSEISSDITPQAVRSIRRDKLHGEYPEAITLAKRILARTDFAISEKATTSHRVPEFAIDMSRIFEFHVLGVLRRHFSGQRILFQEYAGIMGRADYIVPSAQLIVDAKYKPFYTQKSSEILRADIREVSGYSRSQRIRNILKIEDDSEVNCLIIYPNGSYSEETQSLSELPILSQAVPLPGIHSFYTLGIPIPSIINN